MGSVELRAEQLDYIIVRTGIKRGRFSVDRVDFESPQGRLFSIDESFLAHVLDGLGFWPVCPFGELVTGTGLD